jgi:hypothetical protein
MDASRGLWRNVAAQLRNRTMPPTASNLTEEDRLNVVSWIENHLKQTACNAGDYVGAAVTRRLNRREYHHTIRELFGIDFEMNTMLPADGTGGAGFDTNGETLYVPEQLLERYMQVAQQILDRVAITPPLVRVITGDEVKGPIKLAAYTDSQYDLVVLVDGNEAVGGTKLPLKLDGVEIDGVPVNKRRINYGKPVAGPLNGRLSINLSRGNHTLELAGVDRIQITQRTEVPSPEKRALHYRLFGMEAGERPLQARKAARQILASLLPKAFRRPVVDADIDRFMALYDRAAERGDPYEERVKLALKAVLVHPDFLFRVEKKHSQPGIYPLGQYEMATRLSYFLWSTPPDDTLRRMAEQGRLQDAKVITEQVDRLLDDTRSRTFTSSFIGQWLGTQDVGGRVVPLLTELQSYYTPETAGDLRAQPVLLLDRIIGEDRSLLELLTANYMYLTRRLARFYQIEDKVKGLDDSELRLVEWPDDSRSGVLGLAGVLAMTSRYQETSPVLRGAWVLDTLLGTPVPPPPPDVPPLDEAAKGAKMRMREKLMAHRSNAACSACHRLMDPIGFGLENFDWMGRWRTEDHGKPVDASGELPSGEKFNGPVELRAALLGKKDEFVANLTGRVLGYALGRSLQDGDSCTVQKIVQKLEKDGYKARTLLREVVLSLPFRNTQGGAVDIEPQISRRPIDISSLNATKQDAASHNNLVKVDKLTAK